jgi:hypothetical protein
VDVILAEHLSGEQYDGLRAEVAAMPVRDPQLRVRVATSER